MQKRHGLGHCHLAESFKLPIQSWRDRAGKNYTSKCRVKLRLPSPRM